MVFDIITRFNFAEGGDSPLRGRAYVFDSHFRNAYGGDLKTAIGYVRSVIHSSELDPIRNDGTYFTNLIVWGLYAGDKMLDVFAWKFEVNDWNSHPVFRPWVVKNGVIVPLTEATCDNGLHIMDAESKYRSSTINLGEYLTESPRIRGIHYVEGDLTTRSGRTHKKWMDILRELSEK